MGEIHQFRIELGNRGARRVPKGTATTSNHQKNHFLSAATVARTLLLVLPSKLDMRVRSPSPAPTRSSKGQHSPARSLDHNCPALNTSSFARTNYDQRAVGTPGEPSGEREYSRERG